MSNQMLELIAQYAALRRGCEKALALLQDPDADGFDADKVEVLLIKILKTYK